MFNIYYILFNLYALTLNIINQSMMKFLETYYPALLAFLSFLLSVSLWFNDYREEGIFVGIWVPSILCFSIFFKLAKKWVMSNLILFIIGFAIFSTYMFFLVRMTWKQHKIQEQNDRRIINLQNTEQKKNSVAS